MKWLIFFCFFLLTPYIAPRSSYRLPDPSDPLVITYFDSKPNNKYYFPESHFSVNIFHLFDKNHFYANLMPKGPITYRYNPEISVPGHVLHDLIQEAVDEIITLKSGKAPVFKNFEKLKTRDINRQSHTGSYVLKFKNHPFVVKIFIEHPKNIFKIGDKGFEPLCFYYMAGGINRHLTGFTRIKNMQEIKNLVQSDPRWKHRVGFPRKWFWLPKNSEWIHVEGKNIGPHNTAHTKFPAVYAVLCDEIIWSRPFTMKNIHDRSEAIALSNFLHHRIDAHINNFGIEQKSGRIVPIDFEHFPTFVGIKEDKPCTGYFEWYSNLTFKMFSDTMLRDKKTRRKIQHAAYSPFHFLSNTPSPKKSNTCQTSATPQPESQA